MRQGCWFGFGFLGGIRVIQSAFGPRYVSSVLLLQSRILTYVSLVATSASRDLALSGTRIIRSSCGFGCKYILFFCIKRRLPTLASLEGLLCIMEAGFRWHLGVFDHGMDLVIKTLASPGMSDLKHVWRDCFSCCIYYS